MNEIKTPIGTIAHFGTKEEANEMQRVFDGRGKFAKKYCDERGWDMGNVSIIQLLEIRGQEGWKNPVAE